MLGRELRIVLRARMTWWVAALAALLVGHGFVLAVDLYASGSRSVEGNLLLAHAFDPLRGIVRPTLGGSYLAASLLLPVLAARALAIEKERRSFRSLVLATGSPSRVVLAKYGASLAGGALLMAGPLCAIAVWSLLGGHLSGWETVVSLLGHVLYAALVTAIATAAAAWTDTLAQAVALAIVVVLASWGVDAADGIAALAWLGRAADWSITTHLAPFERGTLMLRDALWMSVATTGVLALALVGARFDVGRARRASIAVGAVVATVCALAAAARLGGGIDATEAHRESLPAPVARAVAAIDAPVAIDVWLDRDDSRRIELEADALPRLRLARPDLEVRMPLDGRDEPAPGERDDDYGRLVLHVGARYVETRSTSVEELTTLLLTTAARRVPTDATPEYPGYPHVIAGGERTVLVALAYGILPISLLVVGEVIVRRMRRRRA